LSFFTKPAGITIGEIIAMTGAKARGAAPLDRIIADIASLGRARPSDLTFLDSPKLVDELVSTRAAACLTTEQLETRAPAGVIVLVVKDPMRAFIAVARHLHPESLRPSSLFDAAGVAPNGLRGWPANLRAAFGQQRSAHSRRARRSRTSG